MLSVSVRYESYLEKLGWLRTPNERRREVHYCADANEGIRELIVHDISYLNDFEAIAIARVGSLEVARLRTTGGAAWISDKFSTLTRHVRSNTIPLF